MGMTFKKRQSGSQREEARQFTQKVETLAEISSIDGSQWHLCLHPFEFRRDKNPDLNQLLANSTGNPFFNPAFLAASRDRVTRNKIYQLIVWEVIGNSLSARMALPVQHIAGTFYKKECFSSLTHPYAPLGDPIIGVHDRDTTLSRFSDLLKLAFETGFPPLVLDFVSEVSPINNLHNSPSKQIGIQTIELGKRAGIKSASIKGSTGLISKKRKRELNRLLKKLRAEGEVTFEKVSEPIDIVLRFEEFLLLETRTWKGKHGTSIHTIKRDAAFARQSVSDLAKEGKCEIFSMRLEDEVVASTILFKSSGAYFPWKTAFDTDYYQYSPGSQLMLRLSEDIIERKGFKYADSLAKFGKSWMTGLWPDELSFSKLILAKDQAEAAKLAKQMHFKASLKIIAKKMLGRQ